ncbi:MAG: histidine kinase [Leptospirales bacterium]|nr:histidine kinase [Leptospirales bacterium]
MSKSFFELEQNIRLILNQSQELTLQSSKVNEKVEKYILHILKLILTRYQKERLLDLVYTITKELAINGVKANQKRLFFDEHGLDINNDADYQKGILAFKKAFSDEMNEIYGIKSRQKGIYVKIFLTHSDDGLCVEIENNTPIAPAEERRLREKMKKSMAYNDIAEFYMDNMDNTEGAGLGIALIMIMMKGEGLDAALFRIATLPERTVARVEIPFNANYVSKRGENERVI